MRNRLTVLKNESLFVGERVRLTYYDLDRDAPIEAEWTQDSEYDRLTESGPARPRSVAFIKNRHAEEDKDKQSYSFAIRTKRDDRLVGLVALKGLEPTTGNARLALVIGNPEDRRSGYGEESLDLILRYAFLELNLFRLTAGVFEYDEGTLHLLQKAGFVIEARRRQAVQRDGRRWDMLMLGLLDDEWKKHSTDVSDIGEESR